MLERPPPPDERDERRDSPGPLGHDASHFRRALLAGGVDEHEAGGVELGLHEFDVVGRLRRRRSRLQKVRDGDDADETPRRVVVAHHHGQMPNAAGLHDVDGALARVRRRNGDDVFARGHDSSHGRRRQRVACVRRFVHELQEVPVRHDARNRVGRLRHDESADAVAQNLRERVADAARRLDRPNRRLLLQVLLQFAPADATALLRQDLRDLLPRRQLRRQARPETPKPRRRHA
mmetsp:Transcript_30545/g.93360  ORF Transcript_30545/g.93360 Transcript_30545/m.93360 type:complete len:234 (-) Transcript_30545:22-723(-)